MEQLILKLRYILHFPSSPLSRIPKGLGHIPEQSLAMVSFSPSVFLYQTHFFLFLSCAPRQRSYISGCSLGQILSSQVRYIDIYRYKIPFFQMRLYNGDVPGPLSTLLLTEAVCYRVYRKENNQERMSIGKLQQRLDTKKTGRGRERRKKNCTLQNE